MPAMVIGLMARAAIAQSTSPQVVMPQPGPAFLGKLGRTVKESTLELRI